MTESKVVRLLVLRRGVGGKVLSKMVQPY